MNCDELAMSEKKAVKGTAVIGVGTDDVSLIVNAKRNGQECTGNLDPGKLTVCQQKAVVAARVAEVTDDLLLLLMPKTSVRVAPGMSIVVTLPPDSRKPCSPESSKLPNNISLV